MTEFYRNYLAVAVSRCRRAMVGAMLGVGRLLRPNRPRTKKYISYEAGSDPILRLRPVERPLLRVRAALRDVRRRSRVHLPLGGRVEGLGAGSALVEMASSSCILTLGLVYAWRKGVLRWA